MKETLKQSLESKIKSQEDLLGSYYDSMEFNIKNKEWILVNNYEIRIGVLKMVIDEYKYLLAKC